MATLLTKRSVLLFKIESTEGVDSSPVPASDALAVENIRTSFNPNEIQTNEVNQSLDPFDIIIGGMYAEITFDIYLKGSGTPESPPEWGEVMKVCRWAETITGSAVPAAPEALAAGGSTITAVLGTSASTTAQLYRGMPIVFTGTVPGTSQIYDYSAAKTAKLTDTLGGALVATTDYQIPKNVLYSLGSGSIPSGSLYIYNDGVLFKILGCRGNTSFEHTSGGPAKMTVTLRGMFSSKTDAALPTTAVYDANTTKPIWKNGAFTLNSIPNALSTLTWDLANALINPDNPNSLEGFDPGIITHAMPAGTFDRKATLVATQDVFGAFRAQTKMPIGVRLGSVAGNRIAITFPSALVRNQTPTDRNGYQTDATPFQATGQDSGAFIAHW